MSRFKPEDIKRLDLEYAYLNDSHVHAVFDFAMRQEWEVEKTLAHCVVFMAECKADLVKAHTHHLERCPGPPLVITIDKG